MKRAARAATAGLTALAAVAARDLMRREHTLLRNFPVLGHARYLLEASARAAAVPGRAAPLDEVYGYEPGWGLPAAADRQEIARIMTGEATQGGSARPSQDAVG